MGFFSTQGQVTLDMNSLMWLEVEFIRDFMAVLVTCKIEEDGSKVKSLSSGQHCLHYKSMGKYFIAQEQVTPKKVMGFYSCPHNLQV